MQLNPGRWIPVSTFRRGASEMDTLLSEHLGVTERVCLPWSPALSPAWGLQPRLTSSESHPGPPGTASPPAAAGASAILRLHQRWKCVLMNGLSTAIHQLVKNCIWSIFPGGLASRKEQPERQLCPLTASVSISLAFVMSNSQSEINLFKAGERGNFYFLKPCSFQWPFLKVNKSNALHFKTTTSPFKWPPAVWCLVIKG